MLFRSRLTISSFAGVTFFTYDLCPAECLPTHNPGFFRVYFFWTRRKSRQGFRRWLIRWFTESHVLCASSAFPNLHLVFVIMLTGTRRR